MLYVVIVVIWSIDVPTYMCTCMSLFHVPSVQATNIMFMSEYGNPQLANDEAGYYLTTLEAAARFIEDLSPQKLKVPDV